jgi:hypothetical protein
MIRQQDLQAAYEYGVKLAYEHLQKNAGRELEQQMAEQGVPRQFAGQPGAPAGVGSTAEMPHNFPRPGEVGATHQMAQGGEMFNSQQFNALKQHIAGLPAEARAALGIPNAPQMGEIASRGYGAANSVADRFLSHMGRHPAAYGLGAAGLGAAGLTGLGLGIGNAVHNSNE